MVHQPLNPPLRQTLEAYPGLTWADTLPQEAEGLNMMHAVGCCLTVSELRDNNNKKKNSNNNNNAKADVYGAVVVVQSLRLSSPVSFDECRTAPDV